MNNKQSPPEPHKVFQSDYVSSIITYMEHEQLSDHFFYYVGFPNDPTFPARCAGRKIFKTYYGKQEIIDDLIRNRFIDDIKPYMQKAFGKNRTDEFTPFARRVINTTILVYGLGDDENPFTLGAHAAAHKMAKLVLREAVCLMEM